MEPFEIVGAIVAIAQLIGLCMKCEEQARSLLGSVINAPKELQQLNEKLLRLRLLLQNINDLSEDLENSSAGQLISNAHIGLVYGCLQSSMMTLDRLKALHGDISVRQRLRWATLDKKKAKVILKELKESEEELNMALHVVGM